MELAQQSVSTTYEILRWRRRKEVVDEKKSQYKNILLRDKDADLGRQNSISAARRVCYAFYYCKCSFTMNNLLSLLEEC